MQVPTLAPSPFGIHRAQTRKIIALVSAVGTALFGYGVAVTVLGQLPAGWGVVAVLQFVVMTIGALLVSMMALVTVWFSRQAEPRPLSRRAVLVTGLVAPLVSTGVMVVAYWWRVGDGAFGVRLVQWLLLGQVVLGLQLFVGSLEPARRRRRILAAETLVVFGLVLSLLLVDRWAMAPQSLEAYLVPSGGAAGLFLLFGGPLYLLGNLLVCRPRYHEIE